MAFSSRGGHRHRASCSTSSSSVSWAWRSLQGRCPDARARGSLAQGFTNALSPENLFYAFAGSLIGTLVGVLPGIGPTAGLAILMPLTAVLSPSAAIIMMAAVYYGAMYGGSTTAIVVNIPGEAASVPTALDGYPLARQGRAAAALGISAISSFVAGTLGLVGLTFFTLPLARVALRFGPPEYFALVALSLSLVVGLSRGLAGQGAAQRLPRPPRRDHRARSGFGHGAPDASARRRSPRGCTSWRS